MVEAGAGVDTTWPIGEQRVRDSLASKPLAEYEFVQWREVMQQRYRIDFEPFMRLLAGPEPLDVE